MNTIKNAPRPDRTLYGAAMIVGAVFLMSLQDAVMKLVSGELSLWQIYVLRALLALPAFAALGGFRRTPAAGWIALRAALLTGMYVAIYACVTSLSLPTIAAGFYTGPIFVTLFSALLIREPAGARGWISVAIGFLGVLAILRPGDDAFRPMALMPVLAGALYALAAVLTRARLRGARPAVLAMGLNLALLGAGVVASAAIMAFPPSQAAQTSNPFLFAGWAAMSAFHWVIITLLALFMVGIGLGLAAAYQTAPPATIAAFDYSYLIFAAFWGYALFAETPDAPTIAGMILIAGAGLTSIRRAPEAPVPSASKGASHGSARSPAR